jgi:hypothetical protein
MGRIAILNCVEHEYEYEYRDAEYEYDKKHELLHRGQSTLVVPNDGETL